MIFRKILFSLSLLLLAPLAVAGHGGEGNVSIEEIKLGEGAEAVAFSTVEVHYTGKLEDGKVFDSSVSRGPFKFTLGAGQVIQGWELGIKGMQPGGKRVLTIPPALGYGAKGAGNAIPPNATLIFDVELVALTPPPFVNINNQELAASNKKGVKLIDIRRPDEWQQTGVIEGSIQLTAFDARGQFIPSFLDQLGSTVEPDEEFVLICRTGNRTAMLSNWLASKQGYKNVVNVEDGIVSWIDSGGQVKK